MAGKTMCKNKYCILFINRYLLFLQQNDKASFAEFLYVYAKIHKIHKKHIKYI